MKGLEGYANNVMVACCLSAFITPLLSTMMNLSLVNIGSEFGVGSHDLAYINTAFLLASVITMVPFAKIGDIIGKKRTFVIGLIITMAGCFIASAAPGFWFIILGRAVIGVGSAAISVVSISLLTDLIPSGYRGGIIGVQTACVYVGLSLGPVIGGTLNDLIGWRLLFLLTVPLAAGSILFLLRFPGEIRPDENGTFDSKGSVLYGMSILLLMLGVMNLPGIPGISAIVLGTLILLLFIGSQRNRHDCLLELRLFRNRTFTGSCIAAFMNYAASYSISFFMPLYLQSIGGLSSTEAGLMMIVQPAIQVIGTPVFGRLSDRLKNKALLPTLGMAVTALGVLTIVFYNVDSPLYIALITMLTVGLGFSLFTAANTSVIMSSVPKRHTGEASGMVAVMRQTGMMVSMGIAMMFISVIMGSADNIIPENYDLFIDVIRLSFMTCFAMCLIGTVSSLLRGNTVSETL